MSESRFLAALDTPEAEPRLELLPEPQRGAYEDLLAAVDAARRERPGRESLRRLEARVESGALSPARVRRGARWLGLAAAAALLLVLPWFVEREPGAVAPSALDDADEEPERVDETPIEPSKEEGKDARLPGLTAAAIQKVTRDLGDRLDRLRALPKTTVVVVTGEFDDGASVLRAYRIPHTVLDRNSLAAFDLKDARLLVLCCGRNPTEQQQAALHKKLRDFTNADGSILTTDWALSPYLTELFPAQVKELRPKVRQRDRTLSVTPSKATSPLLAGVFGKQRQRKWWFEGAGKFVLAQGAGTRVLVESADLETQCGTSAVVVTFSVPFARGIVVHTQAHLAQKVEFASTGGIAAMHRLFLNTLLETTK